MKYNPQIHHRRSIRLKGYDYSKAGLYFITICCKDREHLFGEIVGAGVQNFEPLPQKTPQQLQPPRNITPQRNEFQKIIPRSVGSIIRGYKTGVTKWFRNNTEIYKPWQCNFHEHIIRDAESYEKIANYIFNNPQNWREDKFYEP